MIEYGHERVTLHRNDWRWWVWIDEEVEAVLRRAGWARGRSRPVTPGRFCFARGGRAASAEDALDQMHASLRKAKDEAHEYAFRPTHRLGAAGNLISLDAPATPELNAG